MIVKIKLKVYGLLISLFYGKRRIIEQNGLFSRNFIILFILSMSCTYNGFTQEVIKANIIVAKDGTLSVKEEIRNHSSKDILLLSNVFI
jgi:hypothetical protein